MQIGSLLGKLSQHTLTSSKLAIKNRLKETYSEQRQTSKMKLFPKIGTALRCKLLLQKAPP